MNLMPCVLTMLIFVFVAGHDLRRDILKKIENNKKLEDLTNMIDMGMIEEKSKFAKDDDKKYNGDPHRNTGRQNDAEVIFLIDANVNVNKNSKKKDSNDKVAQNKEKKLLIVRTKAKLEDIIKLLTNFPVKKEITITQNGDGNQKYGPNYGYVKGNINNHFYDSSETTNNQETSLGNVVNSNIKGTMNLKPFALAMFSFLLVAGHDLRQDILKKIENDKELEDLANMIDTGMVEERSKFGKVDDKNYNGDPHKNTDRQNDAEAIFLIDANVNVDKNYSKNKEFNANEAKSKKKEHHTNIVRSKAMIADFIKLLINNFSKAWHTS